MNNKKSRMISNLFMERGSFILIGLTGRTGSGCTTAASILEAGLQDIPDLASLNYKNNEFYEGLNKRRYEILSHYSKKNRKKFFSIKVSDIISVYLLQLTRSQAVTFLAGQTSASRSQLVMALKSGSFAASRLNKTTKFKSLTRRILDHGTKLKLDESEEKQFITYMKLVRKFTKDFKAELKVLDNDLYLKAYQAAGNSIRRTGAVTLNYENAEFSPDAVFHLPGTINRVIKIIRGLKEFAFIVIDAIRNPYEAQFFKERYSAFYLVSINTPDEDRKRYLQNDHKLTVDEFDRLERRESGKTDIGDSDFVSQNVQRCIEISDIHIFNPRVEKSNNNIMKAQLAWYYALMLHPGLTTPTSVERVMQIAYTAKSNSGCISRHVGAVVTDADYSIKAVGWNDVPKGQVPCGLRSLERLAGSFNEVEYSFFERNDVAFREEAITKMIALEDQSSVYGRNASYCFKDIKNSLDKNANQVHTRALHAEENAFLQLTKYGFSGVEGGKLFTTASPCELCSKKAVQLGVSEIIFIDPYPGIAKDHILFVGSHKPKLTQFIGAVGRGYHQLYEPTLPYKDELNYLSLPG